MYAIHPGFILNCDGDRHYVTFDTLIALHRLPHRECILWDRHKPESHIGRVWKEYKHVFPGNNIEED